MTTHLTEAIEAAAMEIHERGEVCRETTIVEIITRHIEPVVSVMEADQRTLEWFYKDEAKRKPE